MPSANPTRPSLRRSADLEIGETAGLENLRYAGIVCVRQSGYETPGLALGLGGGWWWLSGDEARQIRIRYAATIVLCALFATVWTFDFALPAAMAADTQATHQALAAISARSTKDCMKAVITSGSIGPLHAPYERCVLSSAAGPTVLYLTQSAASGVAFDPGVETLLGATCVRHLTGRWWQWTTFTGTCPFGYQLASPS